MVLWTVVLEKTLESHLDCKEIQPVHPKGNQSWIFIGRSDAEAETPIFWPTDAKTGSLGKTLMLAKMEGRKRRGRQRMKWLNGTWVWASSASWWWRGKPGVLQSMGLQRVGHDWVTELNWKMWGTLLGRLDESVDKHQTTNAVQWMQVKKIG